MSDHNEDTMQESKQRRQNAKHEPDVYGFEGDSVEGILDALNAAGENATILIHLGRDKDGNAEAFVQVKNSGGTEMGCYNESFTCPPRPEEDCSD